MPDFLDFLGRAFNPTASATDRSGRNTPLGGKAATPRVLASGPGGLSLQTPDNSPTAALTDRVLSRLIGADNVPSDVRTNPLFVPISDFSVTDAGDGRQTFDFGNLGGGTFTGTADEFNNLTGDALVELLGQDVFSGPSQNGTPNIFSPALGAGGANTSQRADGTNRTNGTTQRPAQSLFSDSSSSTENGVQASSDFTSLFASASQDTQQQVLQLLQGN